jgi:hypothetical protein
LVCGMLQVVLELLGQFVQDHKCTPVCKMVVLFLNTSLIITRTDDFFQ